MSYIKRIYFDASENIGIGTSRPQSKLDISGNVKISGFVSSNLIPDTNVTYDLGSSTNRWKDLYLSGNTIDISGTTISRDINGGIKISDNLGNPLDGKFGNLLPSSNLTYDLGSPDNRWKDLYLSGNSIDLSGTILSRHTDGSLMVHDASGNYMTGRFKDVTTTGNISSIGNISTSANLGVGTDNPIYKLHVIGDTRIQGDLTVNGTQTLVNTDIQVTDQVVINNAGTGPALVVTQSGVETIADFCDDTSGNVVMRIANGGNVGIGTSNPQAKLDVSGNGYFRGNTSFTGNITASGNIGIGTSTYPNALTVSYRSGIRIDDGGNNLLLLRELNNPALNGEYGHITTWNTSQNTAQTLVVDGNPLLLNPLGFNVGIGTVYPQAKLHIKSNSGELFRCTDGVHTIYLGCDANQPWFGSLTTSDIRLVTAGTEKMRISSSGNLGIGTNNPKYQLHIQGTSGEVRIHAVGNGDTYPQVSIERSNGNTFTNRIYTHFIDDVGGWNLKDVTAGVSRISCASNGDVTIGSIKLAPSSGSAIISTKSICDNINHADGPVRFYSLQSGTGWMQTSLQLCELNLEGAGTGTVNSAPSLAFHWRGRVASQLRLEASGRIGVYNNPGTGYEAFVCGGLSKSAGTFDIPHPTQSNTRLVHSFIEGPRCDLIYRGRVTLDNGQAYVNIDRDCTAIPECAMTEGTFIALVSNPDFFLQNTTSFARVLGTLTDNILHISCENTSSTDIISWMVIGERKDVFIKDWNRTNEQGYLQTEYIEE